MGYKINENYFDEIDTRNKAYWLGVLWTDGYVGKRDRPHRSLEYNIKLSFQEQDEELLYKFVKSLDSTHPIHTYKFNGFNSSEAKNIEKRVFITNRHMGALLQNKYGIVPRRHEFSKIAHHIPYNLRRHFIRGCLDGDGSLCCYTAKGKNSIIRKVTVSFTTYPELTRFIEAHLIEEGVVEDSKRKLHKRHKEEHKDIHCRTISFCGRVQGLSVLNYLYEDAEIYLKRKYQKYLKIREFAK